MESKSNSYLEKLCVNIPTRLVGSAGNQQATQFFNDLVEQYGWDVQTTAFPAMDWSETGADLEFGGNSFEVFPSPYSKGIQLEAELTAAGTLQELTESDPAGKMLLLHSELAREQLMPKNFIFYNPEDHQKIIALLEEKKPAAILCATGHDGAVAGGIYPFPLIEDGDFQIPSVYMTEEEGERLIRELGATGSLDSRAQRRDSVGYNLVASKGTDNSSRILISAHIDAKIGTPGAIDNGTGVVVLLLLAELLKDYQKGPVIELLPFNGEDYYSVPGQMVYLAQNQGKLDQVLININIDGAGYQNSPTGFSKFDLPDLENMHLDKVIAASETLVEGDQWVQGDHSIFIQQGIPAIAVSSDWFIRNIDTQRITHTPADHPDIVNHQRVVEIARAIHDFVQAAYLSE